MKIETIIVLVGLSVLSSLSADTINGSADVQGSDLKLGLNDGRDKGSLASQRALVHLNSGGFGNASDSLILNYSGDFEGGVRVGGQGVLVDGKLGVGTLNPKSQIQVNQLGVFDEHAGWANFGSNLYYSETGWGRVDTSKGGVNLHMNSTEGSAGQEFRFYLSALSGAARNIAFIGSNANYFEQNVGIGTTTPDYKLDVNGTIRAKEVIVETNWSDYVFEKGYRLRSLKEVDSHIAEYGHLPDVPSAATVQAQGLSLAASQTIMMAKIEELTLYLLEKDKQLDALLERNERLEQRVSDLESGRN